MNSNFNENQIRAYAAAFEDGDAIWCDGKWWETFYEKGCLEYGEGLTSASNNVYYIKSPEIKGVYEGFKAMISPYRVTTLEDYELQGGEKLVWLGRGGINLTFGRIYVVKIDVADTLTIVDDAGYKIFVNSMYFRNLAHWSVIPRYEQVKCSADTTKKEPKFNVGDKVLVNKFIGGTVVEVLGNDKYLVSIVYRSGVEERNEFNGFQLELAKEEPPAPRVITFNEEEINDELNSEVTDFDMDLHRVLSDLESTLKSKNKDYGDSFKQSYDEFGMTAVNIRLTDKFNRFKQLAKGVEPQVDESLKDTIKDIAGYMVLTLIELNREDDNDE